MNSWLRSSQRFQFPATLSQCICFKPHLPTKWFFFACRCRKLGRQGFYVDGKIIFLLNVLTTRWQADKLSQTPSREHAFSKPEAVHGLFAIKQAIRVHFFIRRLPSIGGSKHIRYLVSRNFIVWFFEKFHHFYFFRYLLFVMPFTTYTC